MSRIQIVQGGLFGSEAKGAVASHLALTEGVDIAVRTGATNAGHTVYYNGSRFTMQQLPVAWVRPETELVIGAGALVDPMILKREIATVSAATGEDVTERLFVDYRAYTHEPWHSRESASSGSHYRFGATGKGCSRALISRLQLRGQEDNRISKTASVHGLDGIDIGDTEEYLNRAFDRGAKIQLEGTQGQLLDLVLGPYPYITHKQTGPAQWLLEAGLSPSLPTDIVMVARTFPIRVAGNSGPLPQEISWPILARRINKRRIEHGQDPLLPEEAIREFEAQVAETARGYPIPTGSDGNDQHIWCEEDCLRFKEALSEINARAFGELPEATRNQLSSLFEMTTVTKKLRRIAFLDTPSLRRAARQIRPSRVVITFLNHLFPERWGTADPITDEERFYLHHIEKVCGAPVHWVNRGPLPEHWVKTGDPGVQGSLRVRAAQMGEVG